VAPQEITELLLDPILVPDLDGQRHVLGPRLKEWSEAIKEGVQAREDLRVEEAELKHAAKQLGAQDPCCTQKLFQFFLAIKEQLLMGDDLGNFEAELERLWRLSFFSTSILVGRA
jgi:hypothetical protein